MWASARRSARTTLSSGSLSRRIFSGAQHAVSYWESVIPSAPFAAPTKLRPQSSISDDATLTDGNTYLVDGDRGTSTPAWPEEEGNDLQTVVNTVLFMQRNREGKEVGYEHD